MIVTSSILKKRIKRRDRKIKRLRKARREKACELKKTKRSLKEVGQELSVVKENMTTYFCPYCETHNMISWDFRWGLQTYCPRCGVKIMLCDFCQLRETGCDYDPRVDVCSEMQNEH